MNITEHFFLSFNLIISEKKGHLKARNLLKKRKIADSSSF